MQEVPPEEHAVEESVPPEIEELLCTLQSDGPYLDRRSAALELGNLETSSPRILQALTVAQASDPHPDVRRAAAGSLRAPVHQEYLLQHPDVAKSLERVHDQAPGKGGAGRGGAGQGISLIRCLGVSSVGGLAVGLVIGLWHAGAASSVSGGPGCGAGFLVALIAGAAVGAVVGAAVTWEENRATGMILGAIASAVVAAVSWFPITIVLIVMTGGP